MSIDRGYGIATSAVIADSFDLDALIADTEAAKVAAEAAQAAAETAETNAETAETNAETAQTAAETAQTNAETAETNASASATSASTSASTATTQASNASASASAAATSASNASTSETNAATSATAAQTAQTAAETAQAAAEAAADNFDDTYLGAKASDPTVDNDGDALTAGDLYFNTTSNVMKYYTGSAWEIIAAETFTEVSQDTTPQLGGDLDLNSNDITGTGNIDVTGTVTVDGITNDGNISTDTARSADVVDNDGSFDLDAGTNFTCTPTGNITLTFTNIPDGQSGTIVLVNTGGHTISAHTNTKVMGADMLTTITTAGTYVIGYISDGTNVRVYNSLAQQ